LFRLALLDFLERPGQMPYLPRSLRFGWKDAAKVYSRPFGSPPPRSVSLAQIGTCRNSPLRLGRNLGGGRLLAPFADIESYGVWSRLAPRTLSLREGSVRRGLHLAIASSHQLDRIHAVIEYDVCLAGRVPGPAHLSPKPDYGHVGAQPVVGRYE